MDCLAAERMLVVGEGTAAVVVTAGGTPPLVRDRDYSQDAVLGAPEADAVAVAVGHGSSNTRWDAARYSGTPAPQGTSHSPLLQRTPAAETVPVAADASTDQEDACFPGEPLGVHFVDYFVFGISPEL